MPRIAAYLVIEIETHPISINKKHDTTKHQQ